MEIKIVSQELLTEFILDLVKAKNSIVCLGDRNNIQFGDANQVDAICQLWGSDSDNDYMNCMLSGWLAGKQYNLKHNAHKEYEDIVIATCHTLIAGIKEGENNDSTLH